MKYDAHYNLTTVDPPELVQFIKTYHSEVKRHLPKKTMWQLIDQKADLPTMAVRWCCSELKEGGGKGRLVVTGVRWEESSRRAKRRMVETCMTDNSKRFLHAIIDWTGRDVWEYIRSNNLPYCKLYDEGFKRIGCVLCPMSSNQKTEAVRFPKIVDAYRRAAAKCFDRMVERKKAKGKVVTWKNSDEWIDWWMDRNRKKVDPDQTVIFE